MDELENIRKFVSPEFIFGNNSRKLVARYAKNFEIMKPMIVTDPGLIKAGWLDDIISILDENSIDYIVYDSVTPNPTECEVTEGAKEFIDKNCDSIIALGGGSPMDCAKGIGIIAANGGNILDYEGVDKIESPCPPLIFIPTTSGTSADVSQFAIINNTKERVKIAIISKAIVPDVSLIDPVVTVSMNSKLTAATGMDALTHAVEAYVSNASSFVTDMFSLEAISIVSKFLDNTYKNLDDIDLREKMSRASLSAGLAFSNASLGAVHAMAHSLGGYKNSPHGECNALILPYVIKSNFEYASDRYRTILNILKPGSTELDEESSRELLFETIYSMGKNLNLPMSLSDFGVSKEDLPVLASKAVKDACMATNPCFFSEDEVVGIYEQSF